MIGGNVPNNRRYAVLAEVGVGLGKWRTAKIHYARPMVTGERWLLPDDDPGQFWHLFPVLYDPIG